MNEEAANTEGTGDKEEASVSTEEESEDDSLILEGELKRNPEVPSSDDDEPDEEDEDKLPANIKRKEVIGGKEEQAVGKAKKRKTSLDQVDMIEVEFVFCDMDEKYFHGIKSLLHSSSTLFQPHSSALADLVIANVAIGTVVSTEAEVAAEGDQDVYGFASVLNVSTYQDSPVIQSLKQECLEHCPPDRKKELEVVLSGKTKRPAGFLFHGRMINMPLEIVEVLQSQLVLDMDWAVDNAEGGPEERKSLNFGAFVILAPFQKEGGSMIYRYFDDEIFAEAAEFVFSMDAPKAYSKDEKQYINVIVMTKSGHRSAMSALKRMTGGAVAVKS